MFAVDGVVGRWRRKGGSGLQVDDEGGNKGAATRTTRQEGDGGDVGNKTPGKGYQEAQASNESILEGWLVQLARPGSIH